MHYRIPFSILFILSFNFIVGQEFKPNTQPKYSYFGLGYSFGRTIPANFYFPETQPQQNINVAFGITNFEKQSEWIRFLNFPKVGVLGSYTDFGNPKNVGKAISLVPFIEFKIGESWTNRMSLQTGLGTSYFNVLYDKVNNPTNLAISTHFTWTFRAFLHYAVVSNTNYSIKVGGGFIHHSNGHVQLPNSGLNSFLANVNAEFNFPKKDISNSKKEEEFSNTAKQTYFSSRIGLGQNALSRQDNSIKNVYTYAFSYGKIKKNTYKYGLGFHYRFYEDYYDYIKNNGKIVAEKYPHFKEKPIQYSSNFGITGNFEFLMNHISFETELGVILYKPAFKIDWQLNEEKTRNGVYIPAKFGFAYKAKQLISSRIGLRYYFINSNKAPQHNFFVGGAVNANLGQADFAELNLGYVFCIPKV